MGKTVQNALSSAQLLNGQAVIFLIQKEPCFLPVLYIHQIADAVFHDLPLGVKLLSDEALCALHSLLEAHLGVASLVDAADTDSILCQDPFQNFHDQGLQPVNSKGQGLYHQHI